MRDWEMAKIWLLRRAGARKMTPATVEARSRRLYHAALANGTGRPRRVPRATPAARNAELQRGGRIAARVRASGRGFIEREPATGRPRRWRCSGAVPNRRTLPGRLVGIGLRRYEVESLIAAGGMGEVYRARRHTAGSRRRHQDAARASRRRSERRERFQREAQASSPA